MVRNLPVNAGNTRDKDSIPGSGDPLEKEMATHSSTHLENPMDRRALQAMAHSITKELDMTTEHPHTHTTKFITNKFKRINMDSLCDL